MSATRSRTAGRAMVLPVASRCGSRACREGDLAFEELSRRTLGEGVCDPDDAGIFVGRDSCLRELADLVFGDAPAGFQGDDNRDLFAVRRMRYPDDSCLRDGGMLVEDLLDLPGIH